MRGPAGLRARAMPFADIELSNPRYTSDPLWHLTFQSPALRGRGNVLVYLPPGHESMRDLPCAVLLHGVLGSHWSWAYNGGAHVTAGRLIAEGRIAPMALVMPSDGMVGRGSGYANTAAARCEDWIAEDVLGAAIQTFACLSEASPLFIGGFSMGGLGALRLAAKHAGRFRAASGLSSVVHFDQLSMFVAMDAPEFAALREEDKSVLHWMRANRGALPAVRFDCGVDDRLYPSNVELHEALQREGIAHEFVPHPGTHSWVYWQDHLAETLEFFDRHRGTAKGSEA